MSDEHIQVPPPAHPQPAYLPEANGQPSAATLGTEAPPAPAPELAAGRQGPVESKDSAREIIETVVFVIVLVLLLKSFVAEAFVIPTGSMAETLWGYQKKVECPKCQYVFPVNCSSEVEPPRADRHLVTECICPNCRYGINFEKDNIAVRPETGDRVLVDKSLYDLLEAPNRFDVVVFKYPTEPQQKQVPMNYIKRLVGQPGETMAIFGGDLYRTTDVSYSHRVAPSTPDEQRTETFENDPAAHDLFGKQIENQFSKVDNRGFEIVRKAPEKMLALRRIVFDNDYQPIDLPGHSRWTSEKGWQPDSSQAGRRFQSQPTDRLDWLTYRHVLRGSDRPQLITDFTGYNGGNGKVTGLPRENWVGDLMLECTVQVTKAEGKLVLDLAKGVDRFQARWDLSTGKCTLARVTDLGEEVLDSRPTDLKSTGTFEVRFANFDERLTVWLNGKLPFGEGVSYTPAKNRGPYENDLKPARIGVEAASVAVDHLRLWRDTYYTTALHGQKDPSAADADLGDWQNGSQSWENPLAWDPLRRLPWKTLYVQPGHYLCMGDNSPESSDGRSWGLVPRRLMLGRALLVYYPVNRAGRIR